MQVLIWVGILGTIAAAVWAAGRRGKQQPPQEPEEETDAAERLEAAGTTEALCEVLNMLRAVMEHPRLGGPGFLTVQFPLSGCGLPEASAQYPNIQEALYRRIVRGEMDREALVREGIPAELFDRRPEFAAESGGMVLLSVEVDFLPPELRGLMMERKGRREVLQALSDMLGERYPELAVRAIGGDLLLTPKMNGTE